MARVYRMAELYKSGQTLQAIGDEYGLTRERVRQLISFIGVTRQQGGLHIKAAQKRVVNTAGRDARYLKKYGCSYAQYQLLISNHATRKYAQQKKNAGVRGVSWGFKNLWEWWCVWDSSGKWSQRGRGQGVYVMARKGDAGGYEVGNVFICLATENNSETPQKKSGLPCGVTKKVVGNYVAFVAHKMIQGRSRHIGSFKTPDAAHNAYLAFNG